MKKTLLIVSTLFNLSFQSTYAQFTLRLAGGYAWPGFQNDEQVMSPDINPAQPSIDALAPMANIKDTMNGQPASNKLVHGSYAHGMNFTVGLGYAINKYFAVELGISYLQGATISATEVRQLYISNPGFGLEAIPYYLTADITSKAFGLSLSPSFIIKAPIKKSKFQPYARAGLSLPVFGNSSVHLSMTQNSNLNPILSGAPFFLGEKTEVNLVTQGEFSLGFNGAMGVLYQALPYLSVFAEINGQHLVVKAKSAQITQWDEYASPNSPAVNMIPARGIYRTQFDFVDELNGSSNNLQYNPNANLSEPKQDTRPTAPFSNLGFNIGITFTLGKKTLHKPSTGN